VDDKKGTSPYAYCDNNPLKFTDPTGETSMAAEWVKWQMEDDAFFFGTMAENGIIPYTGWAPKNWFLGSSAELDPDFWAKGWDYKCISDLVASALLWLSMMEWDILTAEGWKHINIGEWIKANGIQISLFNLEFDNRLGWFDPKARRYININLAAILVYSNNGFKDADKYFLPDVTSTIAHEATHAMLYSFGMRSHLQHEILAHGVQIDLFYNTMSPTFLLNAVAYLYYIRGK
jgi:hypothetical protein